MPGNKEVSYKFGKNMYKFCLINDYINRGEDKIDFFFISGFFLPSCTEYVTESEVVKSFSMASNCDSTSSK